MIPKINEYKTRWEIKSDDIIKPGLAAIQEALLKLNNPEKKLKIIHVAGTNGKGSSIAFMEGILKEHGITTGVFSSPAIVDIHDQIRINGEPITEKELNNSFKEMKDASISGLLTDFELLTVAAFCTFNRLAPEYVLLETGMGGKLDSTNVVMPLVSVITSISIEHEAFLGTTLAEVATHKAGIIKRGVPVVIGLMEKESLEVIKYVSRIENAQLFMYDQDFRIVNNGVETFVGTQTYQLPTRRMKGPHQVINAAVAIEALIQGGIKLKEECVTKAIATTQLDHRFQEIAPGVYVDGAHNPAAAQVLVQTIRNEFPGEKVDFVIGMLKGKDIEKTLDTLLPVAASFTFINFSHERAEAAEEIMKYCKHPLKKVTNFTNDTIILRREKKIMKIVTGSLYLLASLKNH